MKRLIGMLAIALAGIGFAGCIAGLIAIWAARPSVLQSSAEMLDALDGNLELVEEKTGRADELVKGIRATVDPITSKILQVADKIDRTPQDEKELNLIDDRLADRLSQIDSIVDSVKTAAAILNKTSQLASSVRLPFRKSAGPSPDEDSQESSKSLAKLATKLQGLRDSVAKLRERREAQKETVDDAIRAIRNVDDDLNDLSSRLQRVSANATSRREDVAEMRSSLPRWINSAAVIGSVILVWMGLGQLALLCRARTWTRRTQLAADSKP